MDCGETGDEVTRTYSSRQTTATSHQCAPHTTHFFDCLSALACSACCSGFFVHRIGCDHAMSAPTATPENLSQARSGQILICVSISKIVRFFAGLVCVCDAHHDDDRPLVANTEAQKWTVKELPKTKPAPKPLKYVEKVPKIGEILHTSLRHPPSSLVLLPCVTMQCTVVIQISMPLHICFTSNHPTCLYTRCIVSEAFGMFVYELLGGDSDDPYRFSSGTRCFVVMFLTVHELLGIV